MKKATKSSGNFCSNSFLNIINRKMNFFITGVSQGFGKELAEHYVKLGHKVYGISRSDLSSESSSFKTLFDSEKFGYYRGSVNDEKDISDAIEEAKTKMGNIDVLINNAAYKVFELPDKMTVKDFTESVNTNLLSPILICQKLLSYFVSRKEGKIINISSNAGMITYAEGTAYCSSKAGLISYSLSLAKYLKNKNVSVNVISPPTFTTGDYRKNYPEINHAKLLKSEQVIKVMDYILFNKKFITGKNYPMFKLKTYIKFIVLKKFEFLGYLFQFRLK
jgi:NAD(P)-dependent dehydrogenase (short-subunit alcohol dehydrogenase family)